MVRVRAAAPSVVEPGERLVMVGTGSIPVPVKLRLLGARSAKFSEALRLPPADGVNVTLTAQVPLGITVAPVQVSALLAKSLAFVPPSFTVEMVRLTVPVLVTVSGWA